MSFLTRIQRHPFVVQRPIIVQFIKFGLVGVLNTGIDFGIYNILVYAIHLPYLLANVISFSIAVLNSYILNRRWTFRSNEQKWKSEATKFLVVNIIGFFIQESLLFVFVEMLHSRAFVAKAIAVVITLFWNFLGTRFWAFRQSPGDLQK